MFQVTDGPSLARDGRHGIAMAIDGHPGNAITIGELQWSLSTGGKQSQYNLMTRVYFSLCSAYISPRSHRVFLIFTPPLEDMTQMMSSLKLNVFESLKIPSEPVTKNVQISKK